MTFAVRNLLDRGVSPDTCTEDGLTALHQVRVISKYGSLSYYDL